MQVDIRKKKQKISTKLKDKTKMDIAVIEYQDDEGDWNPLINITTDGQDGLIEEYYEDSGTYKGCHLRIRYLNRQTTRRKPTGYIATCQCGVNVGAIDLDLSDRQEAGKILGKWVAEGHTLTPQFESSWTENIDVCECKNKGD